MDELLRHFEEHVKLRQEIVESGSNKPGCCSRCIRVFNNPSYSTVTIIVNIACLFSIAVKSLVFGLFKEGVFVWGVAISAINVFFMIEALFDFFTQGYFNAFYQQFRFPVEVLCIIQFALVLYELSLTEKMDDIFFSMQNFETQFELIIFVRLIKTLELLQEIREIKIITKTLQKSVTAAKDILAFFFMLYYVFTVVGISLFGGLVTKGSSVISTCDSSISSMYYLINMNDFLSSYVTLFALTVVNNWFVMANQFVCVKDG